MAEVDEFVTYWASCEECGWEGPDHEDRRELAQIDADNHECSDERDETR